MSCVTHEDLVEIVDYDETISTSPFIKTAGVLRDQLEAADEDSVLSDSDLDEIELYLAAHFYSVRDRDLSSKKTAGASGTFDGKTGMGLESSLYGQTAKLLDSTGFLERRDRGQTTKFGVNTPGTPYSAANGNIHES